MDLQTDGDALLLAGGSCLVHIAPCGIGTTSLQDALWLSRDSTRARGVVPACRMSDPSAAVRAVAGLVDPRSGGHGTPTIAHWLDLVRRVRRARDRRVVLSSDLLASARPAAIRRIVHDLDPDRVHVVVTLRPLARILPSEWQDAVVAGAVASYREWLGGVLGRMADGPEAPFWHRQRHDALIGRWAEVVGPERVTAVVVDEHDHEAVLRVFERLTGLARGTLAADRDLANRSLTLPEIEAIRALNEAFRAEGLGLPFFHRVIRMIAAAHMKTRVPPPGEARIETPRWALERAGEIAAQVVAGIAASGVRVVGDLGSLAAVPPGGLAEDETQDYRITPEIAASLAMGVLLASGLARRGAKAAGRASGQAGADRAFVPRPWVEPPELARVTTGQLAGVLAARTRAASGRGLWAVHRRITRARSA